MNFINIILFKVPGLMLLAGCNPTPEKPNILILTVDDMSCSSVGVYGSDVDNITPNIDKLATESFRFEHAYVNYSICNPSRSTILTGLYTHNHGSFAENGIHDEVTPITRFLKNKGYFTGIMHKEFHYLPMEAFAWDTVFGTKMLEGSRKPSVFKEYATRFFNLAKAEEKPFILVANTADPHRPFATRDKDTYTGSNEPFEFSRLYDTSEVHPPPFLPYHPVFHYDASLYYTSVHRADEMVGSALEALENSGMADNTIVIFISDNGKAFPFAKHDCYVESNKTPLIIRWPGKINAGVDTGHMVTSLDIYPTLMDFLEIKDSPKFDGRSFRSIIEGETQPDREYVFSEYEYHTTREKTVVPYSSRSVQNKTYRYIVNFWSDQEKSIEPAIRYAASYKTIAQSEDSAVARRRDFYFYRVPEELYNIKKDPACMHNLIDDTAHKEVINKLKQQLLKELKRTNDPSAEAFEEGTDEAYREYIKKRTEFGKIVREEQQYLRQFKN